MVIDGVSWRILMDDLATAWRQHSSGGAVELPPVGTSFRRWTQLLGRTPFDADRTHHAAALPTADAPIGRRALTAADTVARERTRTVPVDPVTTAALLGEIPAKFHAGVNDVLLTALAVALARWRRDRGQDQTFAHIELEGHGRESRFVTPAAGFEPELSRTVGWFTTLFPVTVDPGTASDLTAPGYLTAALKAVKEDLARVPAGGLSYGALRYLTGDAPAGGPAPQVLFNYLGRFDAGGTGDWQLAGTTGQLGEKRDPRMRLPRALEFNAIAEPDANGAYELVTTISWPEGVFTEDDITTLGDHFRSALTALAALEDGGHTPSDFPLVPLTQADVDALDGPALHDILPLTPLQEGLYFHSVFDDDATGSYVEQQVMTLDGDVDADRLAAAATRLLTLYPNLAARFTALTDGRVVSVVENGRRAFFTILDGPARTDEEIRELAEQDRRAGFDLATGPLMRYTLIRSDAGHPVLVQTVHHIIADGWSVPPMLRTLLAEYHTPGSVYALGGYRDYVDWLAARDQDESDRVWREELAGLPGPSLVAEGHTPPNGSPMSRWSPPRTSTSPHAPPGSPERGRAQRVGGDPGRAAAQQDVVFGSTVSGRDADVPGIRDMVGLFINTIPVRARWSATDTAYDLLDAVKRHQGAVLPHQHRLSGPTGRQSGTGTLFDTLVVFDVATDVTALRGPGDTLVITDIVNEGAPHYPLTLVVERAPGGRVRFNLIHDGELLRPQAPKRSSPRSPRPHRTALAARTHRSTHCSPRRAGPRHGRPGPHWVSCSTPPRTATRRQPPSPSARWTAPPVPSPTVNWQPRKTRWPPPCERPGSAPGSGSPSPSRAPWNRSSPWSPSSPPEARTYRWTWPTRTSGWRTSSPTPPPSRSRGPGTAQPLHRSAGAGRSGGPRARPGGGFSAGRRTLPRTTSARGPGVRHLHSGSTGRPKGVVVPHSAVTTLLANTRPDMDFGPDDVWVQFHSFSFDFAVWELRGALAHGGELLVPDYALTRSPVDFHRLVRERGVTVSTRLSAFHQFIEADLHAEEPCHGTAPHRLRR